MLPADWEEAGAGFEAGFALGGPFNHADGAAAGPAAGDVLVTAGLLPADCGGARGEALATGDGLGAAGFPAGFGAPFPLPFPPRNWMTR